MSFTKVLVVASLALACAAGGADIAEAAKKKSSAAPTAAQRKAMYDAGIKGCRKKYGARLHFVRVEKFYGKWAAVCYVY